MSAKCGNSHIAESRKRLPIIMRSLLALFVLILLAPPFLPFLHDAAPPASADSFAKWNKVFHLHDGAYLSAGKYDWMNSSGPYNPPYSDYDSDGIPGVTIKKNVPPQRYHAWYLYPPVSESVNITGSVGAYIWAESLGNESGTIVQASFYDITVSQFSDPVSGTLIGSSTSGLVGPYYSISQLVSLVIPSVNYNLPAGHLLALVVERGDSLNDWLIVRYDRMDSDSYIILTTDKFISMDSAWTADASGTPRNVFSDLDSIRVYANVSNPFGATDIYGAYVTVFYASNNTTVVSMQSMSLLSWDNSSDPYWKLYWSILPVLGSGSYVANVTAKDSQGYPSWQNVSFLVVTADHFDVIAPSTIQSGSPFALNLSARNVSDEIVTNWIGTVQLSPYRVDKVTSANGTLSKTSVQFNLSDQGQVNISGETYNYSEEQIYVRASCGPHIGWSELITVRSNPVVTVQIIPAGPIEISSGLNQSLVAMGMDYLGNLNTSWDPYWTVTPLIGNVTSNGVLATFFASGSGTGKVTCTNNQTGASANVSITVVSGLLARINISSPSYPLVIHEAEICALTAMGYDAFDNIVSIADAHWFTTVGSISGLGPAATYSAGYIPQSGVIECRLGSVVASLEVEVLTSDDGPSLNPIPPQVRNEDSQSWDLSLTGYWQHPGGTSQLSWWVEGVNDSLYFILHDPTNRAVMQFFTQPDQFGDDEFTLWVVDSKGYMDFEMVTVSILSINDPPIFVNHPPTELYVTFNKEYVFDYTYYVFDVDNPLTDLAMSSDGAPNIWFEGMDAHFNYSGESSYFKIITMKVQDPDSASSELGIVVRVTKDNPPDLNRSLPDLIIDEGVINYYAFDLDDYFYDLDGSMLIYTTGFENIPAPVINSTTHRVYFSTPGEWSGVTKGTFTAKDPEGAIKVDTISVTVIAVNDPPIINPIGTLFVRYDVPYYLYLSPYVYDPDNSMDTLSFQINDTHVTYGVSTMGADRLEILFPANLTGPTYTGPYRVLVRMNVSDPLGETASAVFDVYVTDDLPPQVVIDNPDQLYIAFPEDTYLNDTVQLYDLIFDEDDYDLAFTITSSGSHVYPDVRSNGSLCLSASENWSGTETLNITGKDHTGAWAFVQVFVIVTPVNDPPIVVNPLQDSIVTGGPRNTQYDISGVFFDSDNEYLTYIAGPETNAQVVGTTLYVSLPAGKDVITVTIEATDGEFTSSMVIFKVGVRKTIEEKIGYPYTLPLVLLAAGVAGYFIGARLPRPYALENLFLIHNDGRLVAHVTREENTNLDKDVVSAMFTAVQEFVRDSFQKGEVGLKKLEIGDKSVMIEKGKSAYLALIYSGWPQKEVFDMLPVLLRDIEERYDQRLEHWNGTTKAVAGAERMLQEYMSSAFKPGSWHEEEEIAEEEWVDILNKEA